MSQNASTPPSGGAKPPESGGGTTPTPEASKKATLDLTTFFQTLLGVALGGALSVLGNWLTSSANLEAAKVGSEASIIAAKGVFDAKMVEIGVNILSADPGKDIVPARQWAITLVETHSGQSFNPLDREQLLHHPIQTVQILPHALNPNGTFGPDVLSCDKWKRNADGSWTSLGTIVLPGNNTFQGITVKGGYEGSELDRKCGNQAGQH